MSRHKLVPTCIAGQPMYHLVLVQRTMNSTVAHKTFQTKELLGWPPPLIIGPASPHLALINMHQKIRGSK